MNEIIKKILEAETKAELLLSQAHENSNKMKIKFENDMVEEIKSAKKKAQEYIKEKIETAKKDSQNEHNTALEKLSNDSSDFIKKNSQKIKDIQNKILKIVLSPDFLK